VIIAPDALVAARGVLCDPGARPMPPLVKYVARVDTLFVRHSAHVYFTALRIVVIELVLAELAVYFGAEPFD